MIISRTHPKSQPPTVTTHRGVDAKRTPDLIKNLKTHPGGHRKLKRFDCRIKALWGLLVNHAGDDFSLTVNTGELAVSLGVHANTIRAWLDFFDHHHLIKRKQRRGGRGRGVVVVITWVQRGEALANRRKRAIEHSKTDHVKPQQDSDSDETLQQRHKTFKDFKQRDFDGHANNDVPVRSSGHGRFVMYHLRQAVNGTGLEPSQRETVLSQIAKWMWAKTVNLAQLRRIHHWLLEQAGKAVNFRGRSLVAWLVRQLHGVIHWARQRQQDRLWAKQLAAFDRAEAVSRASATPEQEVAWRAEARAALVADGWGLQARSAKAVYS